MPRTLDTDTAHNFGVLTAQVFYHMPDYPRLLQEFIWQEYDVAPTFPRFSRFVTYWTQNLDGPIHSIVFAHTSLILPAELRFKNGLLLH